MSEPVVLPSGRNLTVAIAPFDPANKLKKEIAAALVAVDLSGLNLGKLDLNMDLSKLDGPGLNAFKNVLLSLLSSDRVEAAMLACAIRSTIDGEKVTKDSFEAKEARGDFVVVAWEVIRANAGSFFGGLDLSSFIPAKVPKSDPTS